jgi:hypothetical protein
MRHYPAAPTSSVKLFPDAERDRIGDDIFAAFGHVDLHAERACALFLMEVLSWLDPWEPQNLNHPSSP